MSPRTPTIANAAAQTILALGSYLLAGFSILITVAAAITTPVLAVTDGLPWFLVGATVTVTGVVLTKVCLFIASRHFTSRPLRRLVTQNALRAIRRVFRIAFLDSATNLTATVERHLLLAIDLSRRARSGDLKAIDTRFAQIALQQFAASLRARLA